MYKIVGADRKEYGPVTEEQVRQWIAEGRANAQTIARFQDGPWKPLSTFPEFSSLFAATATTPLPPAPTSPSAPAAAETIPPLAPEPVAPGEPPKFNGTAIAGLACSVLGMTCGLCCGPLLSTLGLILSIVGLSQINQNPTRYSGRGIAIAGIVLGLLGYVLFGLLIAKGVFRRAFRRFPRRRFI